MCKEHSKVIDGDFEQANVKPYDLCEWRVESLDKAREWKAIQEETNKIEREG